jgi:hypothetical protein
MVSTQHLIPVAFAIIIFIAVAVFWVVPRRRRNARTRVMDAENQYVVGRPTYARPVSTYKPPNHDTDMELPPYPAAAHVAPGSSTASGPRHDDPVPSYEEAIRQPGPGPVGR